jgi:hypothetical protein
MLADEHAMGRVDGVRKRAILLSSVIHSSTSVLCYLLTTGVSVQIVKYVLYPEGTGGPSCPDIMYFLENFFNLLVIVSSSTNFIIYFAMRRRFRDSLRRHLIICCCSVCCPKTVSRLRRQMSEDTFDSRRYVSGRAASWDVSGRAASLDGNGFNSNGSCRGSASGKAAIFSPLVPGAPSTPKRSQDSDVPLEIGHHHAGGASCWTSCIPHHARERQVIWKDLDEMAANAGGVRNGSLVPCGNLAMHGNGGTGMHNGHSGRVEYRSCADDRTHHHHNGTSMECSPLTSPELPIELTRLDRAGTESDNRDKTTQGEDEL